MKNNLPETFHQHFQTGFRVAVEVVGGCKSQKSVVGYRSRADTILKGKETLLGKSPETAVPVCVASKSIENMTTEELLKIARG